MSTDSNFGLTDKEVVYDLGAELHSKILDVLGYGIYTAVYVVALHLTLSRGTSDRPRVHSAVLITIMWIFVTLHVSVIWAYLDNIYIQHGESREAQLDARFFSRFEEMPVRRLVDMTVILASLLFADIAMIWRCWVLYGRRWFSVIVPLISLGSGSACFIWRITIVFRSHSIVASNKNTNLELSFLSTTVLTNIYCTTATIYRIISISGWRKSLKTYRRLMEILIESSILYTATYVVRIGLEIHTQYFAKERDDRVLFAQALAYSITGIAPTLIIARVAAGYARPDDSWTRTSLPHMGSTMRSLAESLHFAQPATGTVTDNIDLGRSVRSEMEFVAVEAVGPKSTTGGGKKELGQVSKDV